MKSGPEWHNSHLPAPTKSLRPRLAAWVVYRKPYTTRHTFAAWTLMLRVDPSRLSSMMGHGSKKMVFEVYGKYRKGLEQDYDKILAFFGKDFLVTEMQQAHWFTSAFGESLEKVGEKPSGPTHNYLI